MNANDIIDMVWDVKVNGFDMTEFIVDNPNNIERNFVEVTLSRLKVGNTILNFRRADCSTLLTGLH